MEVEYDVPPSCVTLGAQNTILIGGADGSLSLNTYNEDIDIELAWEFKMKSSVRDAQFSGTGTEVYAIARSKAVCSFDLETGVRTRCILNATKDRPTKLFVFPSIASRRHQFCTGDEEGQIKTFDFRVDNPVVCTWKEQEETINALAMDSKCSLLSASSDGTLVAYDSRKCKKRMKSETMHSELLSLCVTDKYVYTGSRDGHIEVFTHGEYGNLLERIESGYMMGVENIVELRKGLLLTGSECSSKLRLLNVLPTKRLGVMGNHGEQDEGVDGIVVSPDKDIFVTYASMANTLKFWNMDKVLEGIPILRASSIKKRKPIVKEGFFDDLLLKSKKRPKTDESDDEDVDSDETSSFSESFDDDEYDDDNEKDSEEDSDDDDDNDDDDDDEDEDDENSD